MKLSVTIITFNEEQNIARAIKSVSFADEIIVIDSYSSDKTVEIAKNLGVQVISEEFLGYGQQKNFAADKCQGEWILNIDADEEVSPELKKAILNTINSNNSYDLYAINRLTDFCGKWIYHGGWYPHYLNRLCRKSKAKWTEPNVHEDLLPVANSPIGKISANLNHYSFPTIESQVTTNIKYAKLGARDLIQRKKRKPNWPEMILRPLGKFFECYFLKKGFLDGKEGFIIAVNAMHSMFMKYSMASYIESSTGVND